MKTFIFLTLVALTAAEWKLKPRNEFVAIKNDCHARFPGDEDSIRDKYPPAVVQPIICLFRGLGIWSDTDGFSVDRLMIGLDSDKQNIVNYNEKLLREGFENCSDKNTEGSSTFNWAYRWFKCFTDNKYLFDSMRKATFYERFPGEE